MNISKINEKVKILFLDGDYEKAAYHLKKILKVSPLNYEANLVYARINIITGNSKEAEFILTKILENQYQYDACEDLITLKINQKKDIEAFDLYQRYIKDLEYLGKKNIIQSIICMLVRLKKIEGLVKYLKLTKLLNLFEKKAIANYMYQNNETIAAIEIADYINEIENRDDEFFHLTGNMYESLGNFDSAIQKYEKAISLSNNDAYLISLSVAQKNMGNKRLALNSLNSIKTESDESNYHKSLLYLEDQNLEKGFTLYESRLNLRERKRLSYFNCINKNEFMIIEKLDDQILILNEQGLGDFIFFSRYFKFLKDYKYVSIEIDYRLKEIYTLSYPNINFITTSEIDLKKFNKTFFIGSLPYFLSKYNFVESNIIKIKSGLKKNEIVALSWRSFQDNLLHHKSIDLRKLSKIIKKISYDIVSVQYGNVINEIYEYNKNEDKKIIILEDIDLKNDMLNIFRLIENSKYVITTCNVIAHIAGVLNKKTYLLAPFYKGKIWYWHSNTIKNLWYPSIKIFENTINGKWDEAITKIEKELD